MANETRTVATLEDLVDPVNGEIINPTDVDALLEAYRRASHASRCCYAFMQNVRAIVADLAPKPAKETVKTVRVAGNNLVAICKLPSPSWDQKILKHLYLSSPALAQTYLRITEVAPNLVEVNKLRNTRATARPLSLFKKELFTAERPAVGIPTITIAEVSHGATAQEPAEDESTGDE